MFKNYNYLRKIAEFIGHTYSTSAEFIRNVYSNAWARIFKMAGRADRIGSAVSYPGVEKRLGIFGLANSGKSVARLTALLGSIH